MRHLSEINEICDPDYEVQPGEHAHLCDSCGTCWRHTSYLLYDPEVTLESYAEAHRCPNCGIEQRKKHFAHEPSIPYILDELALRFNLGDSNATR